MWNTEETSSLEYIEDPYFNPSDSTTTPSLDDTESPDSEDTNLLENELELFDLRQLDFHELTFDSIGSFNTNDESVNVEAEFYFVKRANDILRKFFKMDLKKQVRVTYCDLTKPYTIKFPSEANFRTYLDIATNDG